MSVSGASSVSKQWPYRGTALQCCGPCSVWTSLSSASPWQRHPSLRQPQTFLSMSVCERGPFPTGDARAMGWAGEVGSAVMPAQAPRHTSTSGLGAGYFWSQALLPQTRHSSFSSFCSASPCALRCLRLSSPFRQRPRCFRHSSTLSASCPSLNLSPCPPSAPPHLWNVAQ